MLVNRPALGRGPRSSAETIQRLARSNASNDGVRKRFGPRAGRGGEAAVFSVVQPLRDSPCGEGNGRHASGGGFEPDETKRLWPKARDDKCVTFGEEPPPAGIILPPSKPHVDPAVHCAKRFGGGHERSMLTTLAGHDQAHGSLETLDDKPECDQ